MAQAARARYDCCMPRITRAALIQATGKDPELVEKLVKAADTMRDSGNLYLTWAKHYAALAEGNTDASSDEDETEDFDV